MHFTNGLELLRILPETPERAQKELILQMALGTSLTAGKGYSAPEAEKAYARAWELCQQIGITPRLFPILQGLCGFYMLRGELRIAQELGERSFSLAQNMQDLAYLMWAHFALGG